MCQNVNIKKEIEIHSNSELSEHVRTRNVNLRDNIIQGAFSIRLHRGELSRFHPGSTEVFIEAGGARGELAWEAEKGQRGRAEKCSLMCGTEPDRTGCRC